MATLDEIQRYIDSIPDELSDAEKGLLKSVISNLQASLIRQGDIIVGLTNSAGATVSKAIREFVRSEAYQKSVMNSVKKIRIVTDRKLEFYKDRRLQIDGASVGPQQRLIVDQYIDALDESGMNSRFNQPLRNLIYDTIRTNVSQAELTKNIDDYLTKSQRGDPNVKKYIKQTIMQAADASSAIVDNEVLKRYKDRITHIQVVGSLIETSSPQCRQAVEKYDREIPVGKLDAWIKFAKENGASDELRKDNLPIVKAHFGCRHEWIPYIKVK